MNPLALRLAAQLAASITTGLITNAQVPVTQAEAAVTEAQVKASVTEKVVPVIEHLTNNEPWYQSRVTWGALLSGLASVALAFGIAIDAVDVEQATGVMVGLGGVIGSAITLYGRWKARKPIGA